MRGFFKSKHLNGRERAKVATAAAAHGHKDWGWMFVLLLFGFHFWVPWQQKYVCQTAFSAWMIPKSFLTLNIVSSCKYRLKNKWWLIWLDLENPTHGPDERLSTPLTRCFFYLRYGVKGRFHKLYPKDLLLQPTLNRSSDRATRLLGLLIHLLFVIIQLKTWVKLKVTFRSWRSLQEVSNKRWLEQKAAMDSSHKNRPMKLPEVNNSPRDG